MLHRLGVLLLSQRIDRSQLLPAAGQALQAGLEGLSILLGELSLGRSGLEFEPGGHLAQLVLELGPPVT